MQFEAWLNEDDLENFWRPPMTLDVRDSRSFELAWKCSWAC